MKKYLVNLAINSLLFLLLSFNCPVSAKTPNSPYNQTYPQLCTNSNKIHTKSDCFNAGVINVKQFGAKGNGATNDTASIQNAINSTSKCRNTVFIPSGEYLIDPVVSLNLRSNMELIFGHDAILRAIPTSAEHYALINIENITNISIQGGILVGERSLHKGSLGEWGFGIKITGSNDITVTDTYVEDCWGDGLYIGSTSKQNYSKDIKIINFKSNNNRRQGISLISGKNIEIIRPMVLNTNGTPPSAGIDIEPNKNNEHIENIKIIEPYTSKNTIGILMVLAKLNKSSAPVNIVITNHKDKNSNSGIVIADKGSLVTGNIIINNSVWEDSSMNGLAIRDHDYRSYKIEINNAGIINSNSHYSKSDIRSSAVVIYNQAHPGSKKLPIPIGNIHISGFSITETRLISKIKHAFYIGDENVPKLKGVSILNIKIVGSIRGELVKSEVLNNEDFYFTIQ